MLARARSHCHLRLCLQLTISVRVPLGLQATTVKLTATNAGPRLARMVQLAQKDSIRTSALALQGFLALRVPLTMTSVLLRRA